MSSNFVVVCSGKTSKSYVWRSSLAQLLYHLTGLSSYMLKESDREDSSAGVASTLKLPSTDSQSHQQLVAAEAAEGCRGPGDCLPCARHVLRPSEGAARGLPGPLERFLPSPVKNCRMCLGNAWVSECMGDCWLIDRMSKCAFFFP